MLVGSEDWPLWSDSTDEILSVKLLKKVDSGSDRKMSEYTAYHSVLHMWLQTSQDAHADLCAPLKTPAMDTWASELEQWKKVG